MVNGGPLKASGSARRQPLVKCCFGNTRLKTASRSVQNASSSLPVGTCELMWACDGGGHPQVAPSGRSAAEGTTKATERSDGEGVKGTFQGEQRPTETDPSQDNRWRLR